MQTTDRAASAYTSLQIETSKYTMSESIVYDLVKVNRAIKHYKEDLEAYGWLDEGTKNVIAMLLETVADLKDNQSVCSRIYGKECDRLNRQIQNGDFNE